MDKFKDIRPYRDDEVREVLEGLFGNDELLSAIAKLRFPKAADHFGWLIKPVLRQLLRYQLRGVNDVESFQLVVKKYMEHMISSTTSAFTVSGLQNLDPTKRYCFLSNHRDIALDPAFVSFALWTEDSPTTRIAIGDNLLTKDYVSALMRLNKSFIVNRSEKAPRKMLAALKQLSAYIHHSIVVEHCNIWIAHREGRAKNGWDATEPAIIKMLTINHNRKTESFSDAVRELNIVPVSISYELDPLDAAKANELYTVDQHGAYEKGEQEDIESIAAGIAGQKGAVHVAFGEVLRGEYGGAERVAEEIDRQIVDLYVIHESNALAYKMLHGNYPPINFDSAGVSFTKEQMLEKEPAFVARMMAIPEAQRDYALKMYSYCLERQLK
ncbi:acyltransferase-like protein [Sinobacterium caligoides]|uniref:Acyltransferase-like protein n=1 Tax=Sinobacterium caligoides TaxID=933926 RepID=A0A3N2D5V1_9GAMM|nr:1-acyl-sn-glycerol-3-phosphate acyltransferase [Sinobacterium caligoides]ROR94864.1 acyltransferase-like protein [Sinobacterium caligoides]